MAQAAVNSYSDVKDQYKELENTSAPVSFFPGSPQSFTLKFLNQKESKKEKSSIWQTSTDLSLQLFMELIYLDLLLALFHKSTKVMICLHELPSVHISLINKLMEIFFQVCIFFWLHTIIYTIIH